MEKDKRYKTVKNLISGGFIKSFTEIFETIPKSVVYQDLGMNNARFTALLTNVEHFVLKDIFRISDLLEVEEKVILDLVFNQYILNKKTRKKGKSS